MKEFFKKIFKKEKIKEDEQNITEKIDNMFDSLDSDIITLLIGKDLTNLDSTIINTICEFRDELKNNSGFILPPIHILGNDSLQENEFVIKVRDKEVLQKFVISNQDETKKELRESLEIIYASYLDEIFTYETTEKYINIVQKKHIWTIWNITSLYSITEIREVLIQLLKSKKSIKNINYIFEKFAENALSSGFYEHHSAQRVAKKIAATL